MIFFSDSDCLFKLAACDLLNEAQAAFSFSQNDVQVTDEPLLVLQRQQTRLERQLGQAGYQRALNYIKGCAVIQTSPDPTEEAIIENMLNLDGGEVELICATKFVPEGESFTLVSGDKKWGRELVKNTAGSTIRSRLERRCLHFEQVLLKIIENDANDWVTVRNKIMDAFGCDRKLYDSIFKESRSTRKSDAVIRLKTSIAMLHSETGTLFMV